MQIVIDISEENYRNIKVGSLQWVDYDELLIAVDNGTELPKGHGRLIDADELGKEIYDTTEWNGDVNEIIYKASIDYAQTVLEADKGALK